MRTIIAFAMFLVAAPALPQGADPSPSAPADSKKRPEWSLSASAWTYWIPDRRAYVQPTFTADRGALHLQVRYNYENLETGSAWIGRKFETGGRLNFQITPVLGGVFGKTDGIAPGFSFSLSCWRLKLYSENEYVFDLGGKSSNFFYMWSEFTVSALEWLRAGLAAQRTRAYQTDVDVQRGLTAGVTFKHLDIASYVLNLDRDKQTYILAVTVSF